MLYVGLCLQTIIIQQLAVVEVVRYWSGVALLFIPKVDPDNAGAEHAADDIKIKTDWRK